MGGFWEWINGKKSLIGAVCIWIATYFIGDFLFNVAHYAPTWLTTVQQILNWLGGILVPAGLAHKAFKAATNGKTP